MIVNIEIQKNFDTTFSSLESVIAKFDEENFNKVPFEGSWTPGQVVQHIVLSAGNIPEVLNGKVKDADRDPEEFVAKLESIFLNMDIKMKSPSFIDPEMKDYDKNKLLDKVNQIHYTVVPEIEGLKLDKICTSFEMPGFGNLSRFELLSFIIFHTKRHTKQLDNILTSIKLP